MPVLFQTQSVVNAPAAASLPRPLLPLLLLPAHHSSTACRIVFPPIEMMFHTDVELGMPGFSEGRTVLACGERTHPLSFLLLGLAQGPASPASEKPTKAKRNQRRQAAVRYSMGQYAPRWQLWKKPPLPDLAAKALYSSMYLQTYAPADIIRLAR